LVTLIRPTSIALPQVLPIVCKPTPDKADVHPAAEAAGEHEQFLVDTGDQV
jgi:hypothetical protein